MSARAWCDQVCERGPYLLSALLVSTALAWNGVTP